MKYELMTLDARKILASKRKSRDTGAGEFEWRLDFSSENGDKSAVTISTDRHKENALFRQMCYVLEEQPSEDLLKYKIFYVDFSSVFRNRNKTDHEALALFFKKGFFVEFAGEGNTKQRRHYVPFDSSSGMTRDCKTSFVNEEIRGRLDERLLLGMDLTFGSDNAAEHIQLKKHKYFSYRGLYLTDGFRIEENPECPLNEKTVIVIGDAVVEKSNHFFARVANEEAKTEKAEDKKWIFSSEENYQIEIKPFDGEGIVHPDYAKEWSRQLYEGKAQAHSFQVRMPYTKGMLHCVDFPRVYRKECGIELTSSKPYMIKDAFGRERNLSEARVILTKSMLKNFEWLQKYVTKQAIREKADLDPMKYFFTQMEKYRHALYIVKTELNLHNESRHTDLNYQCLNTLDLSGEEFEKFVRGHIDSVKRIRDYPDDLREFLLGKAETTDCAWKYALSRNLSFLNEEYIQWLIRTELDARIREISTGNISVKGENRFLSGDLLALLIHILRQSGDNTDSNRQKVEELKEKCIGVNSFVAPSPRVKLKCGKTYGFLRNPHLSRNEECVLKCEQEEIYDTYFGELSGIVMTAYKSLAPMTLGGADFDGDIVKMIADNRICAAMRKGRKGEDNKPIERVVIPGSEEKPKPVPAHVTYEDVKDTFGNQIGTVSNLAIRLGEQVYSEGRTDTAYIPADCTILTGLEIDSAKTGVHPKANIEELKKTVEHKDNDYIELLKKLKKARKNKKSNVWKAKTNDEEKKIALSVKLSETSSNIEKLVPLFAETMYEKEKQKKAKFSIDDCFDFSAGEREPVSDKVKKEVREKVNIYTDYSKKYREARAEEAEKKKQNWYGKALVILKRQYYGRADYDKKEQALEECRSAIERVLKEKEYCPEYGETIAERCEYLKKAIALKGWIYTPVEKRMDVLEEILPPDTENEFPEEIFSIVTNFSQKGYMLLYYLVCAAEQSCWTEKELEKNEENKEDKEYQEDKAYKEAEALYRKAVIEKYTASEFESELCAGIREFFYSSNLLENAEILGIIYHTDKWFFWKLFDGESGLKKFKELNPVKDFLPYRKWEQGIPDVEKTEE